MPKTYLTLENIKTWAASLSPTDDVGIACYSRGCPVVKYLLSRGVRVPRVCHESAWWKSPSGHGRHVMLLRQVSALVRKIDEFGQANDKYLFQPLSAAQVLALITEVEQESAHA